MESYYLHQAMKAYKGAVDEVRDIGGHHLQPQTTGSHAPPWTLEKVFLVDLMEARPIAIRGQTAAGQPASQAVGTYRGAPWAGTCQHV